MTEAEREIGEAIARVIWPGLETAHITNHEAETGLAVYIRALEIAAEDGWTKVEILECDPLLYDSSD